MDLFRDIKKGKFGQNPKLKKEAKHELNELGGEKVAEAHEKKVEMAKKMSINKFLDKQMGHPLKQLAKLKIR